MKKPSRDRWKALKAAFRSHVAINKSLPSLENTPREDSEGISAFFSFDQMLTSGLAKKVIKELKVRYSPILRFSVMLY